MAREAFRGVKLAILSLRNSGIGKELISFLAVPSRSPRLIAAVLKEVGERIGVPRGTKEAGISLGRDVARALWAIRLTIIVIQNV